MDIYFKYKVEQALRIQAAFTLKLNIKNEQKNCGNNFSVSCIRSNNRCSSFLAIIFAPSSKPSLYPAHAEKSRPSPF